MALHVHPTIASLKPYSPGKPIAELERELGIREAIKLASNENPWGPSPKALQVIEHAAASLHRYPDGGAHDLRQALASKWQVSHDQVLVGNGSDEIISLLIKTFLSPGEEAVMADLTFVMYRLSVLASHGVPVEVPLKNWTHDLPAMMDAITNRTRLFFICNPNNPTGTMLSATEIESALAKIPEHVVVVFDEAYYEYVRDAEYPDSLRYVRDGRPVVVLRTFSKIYGLAGCGLFIRMLPCALLANISHLEKFRLKTIAFPNISTGVYGFPKPLAAEIAIEAVRSFLEQPGSVEEVLFVVFDEENYTLYNKLFS